MSAGIELQDRSNEGTNASGQNVENPDPPSSVDNSASTTGHDYFNAIKRLRERTINEIQKYGINHPLIHNDRGKLKQDIKPLDEFPVGYPKIAAYEACDNNFLIYRKFGWLRNRVLLRIQDELMVLEEELTNLDQYDKEHEPARLISRRRDEALDSKRKDLLSKVEDRLHHFDELLLRMNQISRMEIPSERNQKSVYNIIHSTGSQVQAESEWIGDRDDLVAVAPDQERSLLNAFVEELPKLISRPLTAKLYRTEDQRRRTGKELVNLYSKRRVDIVTNALMTLITTLLLLLPIGILALTQIDTVLQLVVILCFIQLFGLCVTTLTSARKQEVFAATAAYAAVLVVFLANNNSINTPQARS